jgi:uncharacterized membrane protein (DUF106 family)
MIPLVLILPITGAPIWLSLFISMVNIAYVAIVFTYIRELKQKQCQCSVEPIRDVLEIVNYFQLALLIISVIVSLVVIVNKSVSTSTTVVKPHKKK